MLGFSLLTKKTDSVCENCARQKCRRDGHFSTDKHFWGGYSNITFWQLNAAPYRPLTCGTDTSLGPPANCRVTRIACVVITFIHYVVFNIIRVNCYTLLLPLTYVYNTVFIYNIHLDSEILLVDLLNKPCRIQAENEVYMTVPTHSQV